MGWPHTSDSATIASMEDAGHLLAERAVLLDKSEDVRPPRPTTEVEFSIAIWMPGCRPDPTWTEGWAMLGNGTVLVDLRPEPIDDWSVATGEGTGDRAERLSAAYL